MPTRLLAIWLGAMVLSACGGDSTGPAAKGISVVAAPALSDTIDAMPAQPLVVEVHGGGSMTAGLTVRFETIPPRDRTPPYGYRMVFRRGASITVPYLDVASDTTDDRGRASAYLRFGTIAGDAQLVVSCPELGISDTVQFTVRPGAPAAVRLTVKDTILAAGGQYTVGGYLEDRWGERVAGSLLYQAGENVSAVDASGLVTAGNVIGPGWLLVRSGGLVETARFTVLPKVQTATLWVLPDLSSRIVRMNLDGSSRKELASATGPAFPSPSPTSDEVVFQQRYSDYAFRLYVADGTSASPRPLVDTSVMADARAPHFSSDGQRVYFVGHPAEATVFSVWRVRRDGTALERVVDLASSNDCDGGGRFAVSPDESLVAYCDGFDVVLLTLATGERRKIGSYATQPAFSPDGRRVAFTRMYEVVVVNTDGSPYRTSYVPGWFGSQSITWLPGGQWLLMRGDLGPMLVGAATGERFSIPVLTRYHQIAAAY